MRVALLTALVILLIPAAAIALVCGSKPVIEAWLEKNYGERLLFTATNQAGDQVVLYLNPESGTWSALLRPRQTPDLLCPLDSGQGGQPHPFLPET